jgi:hypothetical protein
MQQKEKKMQAFIDDFDATRHKHKEAARLVQEKIVQLLKQTNQVMLILFARNTIFNLTIDANKSISDF